MKLWVKYVVMLSIIAGVVLLTGGQEKFFAWGDEENINKEILSIISGGQQDAVPDDKETAPDPGPGAFTVGSPTGAEAPEAEYEFPLMQLLIDTSKLPYCPEDPSYQKGTITLEVVASMDVFLWEDEEKQIPLLGWKDEEKQIPKPGNGKSKPIPLSELPDPLWVEVTEPSEEWGDIEFTASYKYKECKYEDFRDTVNATALLVDLDIHHGNEERTEVTDTQEEISGAFTLANLNDTDADGIIDKEDDYVVPPLFVVEADLMKLILRKPEPTSLVDKLAHENVGKTIQLKVFPDTVKLWEKSTKKQEIPGTNGIFEFPLSDLDREVWVEITEPSTSLRDVKIELEYLGGKDVVYATGGWVEFGKMWEAGNKANQIYNPTLKDDTPIFTNKLYLVEDPDYSMFHVNLEVADTPVALRDKLMYAVFSGDSPLVEYFFPPTGPVTISFDHPGTLLTDFPIRVGYDWNENSHLDDSETIKLSVVHYKLTAQSFENLRTARIPDDILKDLKEYMEDYGFRGKEEFLDAVHAHIDINKIGRSLTPREEALFVQHAAISSKNSDEPIVRGTNSDYYPIAKETIKSVADGKPGALLCEVVIPPSPLPPSPGLPGSLVHTPHLVRIFLDGGIGTLDPDKSEYHPNSKLTKTITFNCFTSPYSEWLTHNSGADGFNEPGNTGTVEIQEYTWDHTKPLAKAIGTSHQIREAGKSYYLTYIEPMFVQPYFANQPAGGPPVTFPLSGGFYNNVRDAYEKKSPPWVPQATVEFDTPGDPYLCDDLLVGIGRGRIVDHQAQYTVEKKQGLFEPYLEVTQARYIGEMEDLYDYNRDGGKPADEAAVLQLGHRKGTESRKYGVIYRLKVIFDETIDSPF